MSRVWVREKEKGPRLTANESLLSKDTSRDNMEALLNISKLHLSGMVCWQCDVGEKLCWNLMFGNILWLFSTSFEIRF